MPQPQFGSLFFTLTALTVREGIRQRLAWVMLGMVLVGLCLAGFAGSLAITEAEQVRSTLLGAFLRLSAALLTALSVLHSQNQEYQDKRAEWLFSLPLPRTVYLFGKLAGYAILIGIMAVLLASVLPFFAPPAQVALWAGSLFWELWIVAAFSLLVQWTIRSLPAAFLLVLLFYLLSRTLAGMQSVGHGAILPQEGLPWLAAQAVLEVISFLLPRLDRFTQSEWLAYGSGNWADLLFVLAQGGSYLILLAGVSLWDLSRKRL
ncbi:MAG: ABC transporter permease [Magnetococcales bacterium]|nr:ABC transporter permease [Magnetococcales bacterium]